MNEGLQIKEKERMLQSQALASLPNKTILAYYYFCQ